MLVNFILAALLAVVFVLTAYLHVQNLLLRRLMRRVVGRALVALKRRGVPKQRAVDLVCPELRDELMRLKPSASDASSRVSN